MLLLLLRGWVILPVFLSRSHSVATTDSHRSGHLFSSFREMRSHFHRARTTTSQMNDLRRRTFAKGLGFVVGVPASGKGAVQVRCLILA